MLRTISIAALLLLVACTAPTEPAGEARIVFRPDPASCLVAHTWTLFIDGNHVGTHPLAPGDSAAFPVEPGYHAIGGVAPTLTGFSIAFSRVVEIRAGATYTPFLSCR